MRSPCILGGVESITQSIRIVLCNPKTSANIGAVCRAMKTMDITRLDIVAPAAPIDEHEVRVMAIHASDVFDNARRFDRLEDAIASATLVAGTTRRVGSHRSQPRFSPEAFAEYAVGFTHGEVAIVFGNEEHGLTTEQLRLCPVVLSIPTSEAFPSLNLSHAVQIVCYALFRAGVHPSERVVVTSERIERLMQTVMACFTTLGFFRVFSGRDTERLFREVFSRAALGPREADRLEKMFHKIPYVGAKQSLDSDRPVEAPE